LLYATSLPAVGILLVVMNAFTHAFGLVVLWFDIAILDACPAQAAFDFFLLRASDALVPPAAGALRLGFQQALIVLYAIAATFRGPTWNTLDATALRLTMAVRVIHATLDPCVVTATLAIPCLAFTALRFRRGFALRVLPVMAISALFADHGAIPDLIILRLLLPTIVHPQPIRGACRVATRPMIILLVTRAARAHTALGGRTTLAIVGARWGGQRSAIPNLLVLLVPLIVVPLVVRVARGIATRPMIVLLVASCAPFRATLRLTARLPVLRARGGGELFAIPHIIIHDTPRASHPLVVVGARGIATCPMIILLETCAACVVAALRVRTIVAVVHAPGFALGH